jgi:hypothetical protein
MADISPSIIPTNEIDSATIESSIQSVIAATPAPTIPANPPNWFTNNVGTIALAGGGFKSVASPNSLFSLITQQLGVQTTPQTARGYMPGSAIDYMNNNLVHNCDFNFMFNITGSLADIITILGAIPNAIKNAKNKAARAVSEAFNLFIEAITKLLKGISEALSLGDPSGQVTLTYQLAKKTIADIQDLVNKIAQKIENVLAVIFYIQDVAALLKWVLGLPSAIIQMVKDCISQFTTSLKSAINTIKSAPGVVLSNIQGSINSVTTAVNSTYQDIVTAATATTNNLNSTGGLPPELIQAANNPALANPDNLSGVLTKVFTSSASQGQTNPQNNSSSTTGP